MLYLHFAYPVHGLPFFADILTNLSDICKATHAAGDVAVYEVAHRQLKDFTDDYNRHLAEPENALLLNETFAACLETYCGENIKEELKGNGCRFYISEQNVVKLSPLYYSTSGRIVDDPVSEAAWNGVLSSHGNPAMLRRVAAFPLGNYYVSVTPKATQNTLLDYCNSTERNPETAHEILLDSMYGLAYMKHEHRVPHNDVKPDNLFITKDNQAVVADNGVANTVANAPREYALQRAWQHHEAKLVRNGATATEIQQEQDTFVEEKFEDAYALCNHKHESTARLFEAFRRNTLVPEDRIEGMPVRLDKVLDAAEQGLGLDVAHIMSIDGYINPNDPGMFGAELVESFKAHLRNQYPLSDEAALKQALGLHTARLLPNLAPQVYAVACKPEIEIAASPIQGRRGTEQYMCPSLYAELPTDPFAADIYSLGVTLFCVATGFHPYTHPSMNDRAFAELQRGGVGHLLHCYGRRDAVTPECLALLEKMMSFNPAARPTIDECIELFKNVQLKNYC